MNENEMNYVRNNAVNFGIEICELSHSIGSIESILESSAFSDEAKQKIAATQVIEFRKQVQLMVDNNHADYSGVMAAVRARIQIQARLSEFEKIAEPYLR